MKVKKSISLAESLAAMVNEISHQKNLNFSQTVAYIIKEYFRLTQAVDKLRQDSAILEKLTDANEFKEALVQDMDRLKQENREIMHMLGIIGINGLDLRKQFKAAFPQYIK